MTITVLEHVVLLIQLISIDVDEVVLTVNRFVFVVLHNTAGCVTLNLKVIRIRSHQITKVILLC